MRNRHTSRFNQRQLHIFAACVVVGFLIGFVSGDPASWLMTGAIVGAAAIAAYSWWQTAHSDE